MLCGIMGTIKMILAFFLVFKICDSTYWWLGTQVFREGKSLVSSTSSGNNRNNRHWSNAETKRDDEDDVAWRKYNREKGSIDSERETRKKYKQKGSSFWKTSSRSNDNDYSDYSIWISDSRDNTEWSRASNDDKDWTSSNNDDKAWSGSNIDNEAWSGSNNDDQGWSSSDIDNTAWSNNDNTEWSSSNDDNTAWLSSNNDNTAWSSTHNNDDDGSKFINTDDSSCQRPTSASSQSTCEDRKSNCWSPGI